MGKPKQMHKPMLIWAWPCWASKEYTKKNYLPPNQAGPSAATPRGGLTGGPKGFGWASAGRHPKPRPASPHRLRGIRSCPSRKGCIN